MEGGGETPYVQGTIYRVTEGTICRAIVVPYLTKLFNVFYSAINYSVTDILLFNFLLILLSDLPVAFFQTTVGLGTPSA